jgi:hypothetical protein
LTGTSLRYKLFNGYNKNTISNDTKGVFGWSFQPAFAFAKGKSQPKVSKALGDFVQKQLSLQYKCKSISPPTFSGF